MSKLTQFLSLFKFEKTVDDQRTFNIDTALNENWDKVDEAVEALDTELTTVGDRTSVLEEKIDTPDLGTITLDKDNISKTVTDAVEGTTILKKVGGATLNNIVTDNRLYWTYSGSINTISGNIITNTGDGTTTSPYTRKSISKIKTGIKYFTGISARVLDVGCIKLFSRMFNNDNDDVVIENPTIGTWYNLIGFRTFTSTVDLYSYVIHLYADAASSNGKRIEVNMDTFFAIPLTGTQQALYTTEQLSNVVAKYFEGLHSTNEVTTEARGNQTFDKNDLYVVGYVLDASTGDETTNSTGTISKYIPVSIGDTINVLKGLGSGGSGHCFYNKQKNFVSGVVSWTPEPQQFISPVNGFLRVSTLIPNLDAQMVNIGPSQLPHEDYYGGTQTITCTDEVKFSLSQVTNGTQNTIENGFANKRNISGLVLDGTLSWESIGSFTNVYRVRLPNFIAMKGLKQATNDSIYASNGVDNPTFLANADVDQENISIGYTSSNGYLYISVEKSKIDAMVSGSTVNGFKEYLNLHPYAMVAQLATPETKPEKDFADWGIQITGSLKNGTGNLESIVTADILPSEITIEYSRNISQSVNNNTDAISSLEHQVDGKANKVQEDWVSPTLLSGWIHNASYSPPGYLLNSLGFVELRGGVENGVTGAGNPVWILPIGRRPSHTLNFKCYNSPRVIVRTTGEIEIISLDGAGFVDLSNITFKAV